jgi:hypothetical protein
VHPILRPISLANVESCLSRKLSTVIMFLLTFLLVILVLSGVFESLAANVIVVILYIVSVETCK